MRKLIGENRVNKGTKTNLMIADDDIIELTKLIKFLLTFEHLDAMSTPFVENQSKLASHLA